jgi:formylmethanofuran dehydrogenase subunit D
VTCDSVTDGAIVLKTSNTGSSHNEGQIFIGYATWSSVLSHDCSDP